MFVSLYDIAFLKCRLLILKRLIFWRLLNFGDIGGKGKERKNVSPPILNTVLNRGTDKMESPDSISDIFFTIHETIHCDIGLESPP